MLEIENKNKVYGVGIKDADYRVTSYLNGKRVMCAYYEKWCCMMGRCYSRKFQANNKTYITCSVCDEWINFSIFMMLALNLTLQSNHLKLRNGLQT